MLNIKVGVMPGKLTEVIAEEGTKVRDIFTLAEIDIEGYELRLDGEKVKEYDEVQSGNLLVAMKKIKGNSSTLKVGVMPGKLTEIVLLPNTTAFEAFDIAEIDVTGYELRLDGEKIDGDCTVNGGNLLVAMKKIKGNKWERDDSSEYHNLPITVDEIAEMDDLVILDGKYVMLREEFEEVYEEIEEKIYSEYDREKLVDVYSEVESIVDDLRTVLREIEDLLNM